MEQDGQVANTPAFGLESPRFDPRQQLPCAAATAVAKTVTYKLVKFIFTVYHPIFRIRHYGYMVNRLNGAGSLI